MKKTYCCISRVGLACLTTILFFTANAEAAYVENPMTEDLQAAGYTVQGVGTLVATNMGAGSLNTLSLITCDPWVDARAFGTNYSSGTISAALTAIGSSEATLLLAPGTWTISGSLTIPANIVLKFMRGAVLDIAAGQTIAIDGNIEAGLYQIIDDADADGDGVEIGGFAAAFAPVTWWGASPSASAAANNVAFQQAINCLNRTAIPMYVPAGTYQLSAILNHKVVDIYGDSMQFTVLNNSAVCCMQADSNDPADCVFVKNITLRGAQFGYHSNGQAQNALQIDRVAFDGGLSDNIAPPTRGYGVYCNSKWIGCRLTQCTISQMGWFSGFAMNNNVIELSRINDSGTNAYGGHVLYIGDGPLVGAKSMFIVRDCVVQRGSIKVHDSGGNIGNIAIENTSIVDAPSLGTNGILVGNCGSITLRNIMATNYSIIYTGTVSISFIQDVACYKFDLNRQPNSFAWGVTAHDNYTPTTINDSSVMEYAGGLYGRAFMKRSVSVRLPADTSATQTWYRVLHTTTRKSWITEMRITAESNIAGTNTDYASLRFLGRNGTAYLGSYAFTNGNSMTAFAPKELPFTDASNLANESLLLQKTVTGTGRQLPPLTITVEYYDQGAM